MMLFGLFSFVMVLLLHFGNMGSFMIVEGDMSNNLSTLTELVFPEGSASLGFWSMFLSVILPVILVTVLGVKLLFQLKGRFKMTFIIGLVIWIIAICTLSFVGVETGLEFRNEYSALDKVEQNDVMTSDTLYVDMKDPLWNDETFDFSYNDYLAFDYDSLTVGFPLIKVQHNIAGGDVIVSTKKRSNGSSVQDARKNAENISYPSTLTGNRLMIPASYSFPAEDKIRGQHATLLISLPIGKSVIFPANMDDFPIDFQDCDHFSDDFLEEPSVWEATEDGMEYIGVYRGGRVK